MRLSREPYQCQNRLLWAGLILGERYAFSESLRQSFMDTGTIHIVTIGGYHVTLVAQWIMEIFSFSTKITQA